MAQVDSDKLRKLMRFMLKSNQKITWNYNSDLIELLSLKFKF